jgi:peptidoglycan-N-acetylglucosamine deacetylase
VNAHSGRAWSPSPLISASIGLHVGAVLGAAACPAAWPWVAGALAANHAGLTVLGMLPRSRLLGCNLVRLPPASANRQLVALTFDDGPDPNVTPRLLDLLDRHGARASFFCIGRRAAAYPHLVRDIHRRGHGIENHTDRHPNAFAFLPPAALKREIAAAQSRLSDIVGAAPRFFRSPMGFRSPLLDPVLARLGLDLVSWTRRACDGVRAPSPRILRRLTNGVEAGDILMLHDGGGRPAVLDVVPMLLAHLDAAGLAAVSLTAALADPGANGCRASPAMAPAKAIEKPGISLDREFPSDRADRSGDVTPLVSH